MIYLEIKSQSGGDLGSAGTGGSPFYLRSYMADNSASLLGLFLEAQTPGLLALLPNRIRGLGMLILVFMYERAS